MTADGISAFFSALRRPSTGQLSVCSTVEGVNSPNPDAEPAAAAPLPDHPMTPAEPTPANPMEPVSAPSQPPVTLAIVPVPPVAEPKATAAHPTAPSEAESVATTISLGPSWEKDEFTWEQQSDGTYVKKPKPAAPPAPITEAAAPPTAVAPPVVVAPAAPTPAGATPAAPTPAPTPPAARPAGATQAEATLAALASPRSIPPDTGAVASDDEEQKAKRARYMKFYRNVRGPNCPKEVKAKFKEALNEPDRDTSQAKMKELFNQYCQCNADWLQSDIMLAHQRSHGTRNLGVWKWMTKDDTRFELKWDWVPHILYLMGMFKEKPSNLSPNLEVWGTPYFQTFPYLNVYKPSMHLYNQVNNNNVPSISIPMLRIFWRSTTAGCLWWKN